MLTPVKEQFAINTFKQIVAYSSSALTYSSKALVFKNSSHDDLSLEVVYSSKLWLLQ